MSKRLEYILVSIIVLLALIVLSFLFMMFYNLKTDISNQEPYSQYLNTPIEVTTPFAIRWQKDSGRFSNYSITNDTTV